MWQILAFLIVGCCYSSAEQHKVTIAAIPVDLKEPEVNNTGGAESRIIGGRPASIELYPYAVQVLQNDQLSCGGSLITRRHVLSAAHCFVDSRDVLLSTSIFTCRVGSTTVNTGGSVHRVSFIINHERFNRDAPRDNDISVVLLATTVTLSASVATAIIPSQGEYVPDNMVVYVVGWGQTTLGGPPSTVLNEVWVYTVNLGICAIRYSNLELINNTPYPLTNNMMCTGLPGVGGRDACQGDNGGPVIYRGIVVGVTSWGESCAHYYYPRVNARVSAYTDWINTTVLQNNQLSCGGSLLTRRHVLSAAHCFIDSQNELLSASLFRCRVGSATLNSGGSVFRVSQIINHERYNLDAPRDNDISVLLLRTTVSLSATVGLAAIPDGGIVPDNAIVWIVGWGRVMRPPIWNKDEQASSILQDTFVYQINHEVCAQRYRELEVINNAPYPVTDNMMCSGMLDVGGRGACGGDDGGPVVYASIVVGVSSWRENCGHPYYPGVSVRLAAYTGWINDTVTRYNGAPSLGQTSVLFLLCSFLVATMFSKKL